MPKAEDKCASAAKANTKQDQASINTADGMDQAETITAVKELKAQIRGRKRD